MLEALIIIMVLLSIPAGIGWGMILEHLVTRNDRRRDPWLP
jgi:hypothetical protein